MKIELQDLFEQSLTKGLNLFVGAGFSVLAKNKSGQPLPIGAKLQQDLVAHFHQNELKDLPLPQLAAILEAENRDGLRDFLIDAFSVSSAPPEYAVIEGLNIKSIFTTNIDNLVPKIFEKSTRKYINNTLQNGPAFADKSAINFLPLHGNVSVDGRSFIFSSLDLASAFSENAINWSSLIVDLGRAPTLFWGYNLDDPGALAAISKRTQQSAEIHPRWITMREANPAKERYLRALGFHTIVADTNELLDFLATRRARPVSAARNAGISWEGLEDLTLPHASKVAVRSLREFMCGAPPVWHDIYTGRVPTLSHYWSLRDKIASGRHCAVIGIPASGKTTLMMQLAAHLNQHAATPTHIFVANSLPLSRARVIVDRLNGEKAAIFIDNYADSLETVEFLQALPNIQLVVFDQTYQHDLVLHRLTSLLWLTEDITDLAPKDLQAIFDAIPAEMRQASLRQPAVTAETKPSLFEVIEGNSSLPTLTQRMSTVLDQLDAESVDLHDLLTMCCYVHSCRTPVTFGMIYSFLGRSIQGYKDVALYIEHLRKLVVDAPLIVDQEEDCFAPRSTVFSNAVLKQIKSSRLKRMLVRFFTEISRTKIAEYSTFQRKAFDAGLMNIAFQHWREGADFYGKQIAQDPNPYLKQQAALYLHGKKKFTEAFDLIDRAQMDSRGKIFSIRNTYAVILFDANYEKDDAIVSVLNTLQESMQILEQCYLADKRKNYHAIKYSEQAYRYWQKYPGEKALAYLSNALTWLKDVRRTSFWDQKILNQIRLLEGIADLKR